MRPIEIPAPDFDLRKTLNSGQVFHWEKIDNGFLGTIGDVPACVQQDDDILEVRFGETRKPTRSPRRIRPLADETRALSRLVTHYFALDHSLAEICASFPDDALMNAACDFCRGLRIIRQPKWECLATFICSSMKQVAHIRQISAVVRARFGERRGIGKHVVYTFPHAQRIARASETELRECKLGYRAKNLRATARRVSSGEFDLEKWSRLPDADLRKNLRELPGVGAKIANCVMLFAYERLRAFPIDVWIERTLKQQYFPRKKKVTELQLREFSESYFGEHGGYAQQYLFHHARVAKSLISRESSTPKAFGAQNDKRKNERIGGRGRLR
jgi:N-glycosylase/DNA lyase